MTKKRNFIYELFSGYREEQIDKVLSELSACDVDLVNSFCNEVDLQMTKFDRYLVESFVIPMIRESLVKQYGQPIGNKSIYGLFIGYKQWQIDDVLSDCDPKAVNLIYRWCSENEIEKNLCLDYLIRIRRVRMSSVEISAVEILLIPWVRKSLAEKYGKLMGNESIYELFNDYSREQVDAVIATLSDNDKKLIILKYGEDLDNSESLEITEEQENNFYNSLLPRVKSLLEKANEDIVESDVAKIIQKTSEENIIELIDYSVEISSEKLLIKKRERI